MAIGPACICCIFLCWNRQAISLCSARATCLLLRATSNCVWGQLSRVGDRAFPYRGSLIGHIHGTSTWLCAAYASFGASTVTSVWSLCEMEALLTHCRLCSRLPYPQDKPMRFGSNGNRQAYRADSETASRHLRSGDGLIPGRTARRKGT